MRRAGAGLQARRADSPGFWSNGACEAFTNNSIRATTVNTHAHLAPLGPPATQICFFAHTEAQLRRTRASPAGSETSGDSTATAPAPAGLAGPAGRAVAFVPLSAAAAAQLRAARTAAAAAAPALAPAPAGALLRPWLAGAPADAAAAAGVPAAPMPARLRGVVLGVSSGSPVVGSSAAQYTVLVPATAAPPATQVLGHPQVLRAAQPREQLLGVDCVAVVPDSSMQAPAAALWAFTQQQQMLQQHQQQHQQQHKQQSDMLQALLHDAQAAATAAVRADAAARNAAGLVAEFATAAGLPVLLPASAALQPPAAQGQLPSVRSAPAEGAGFAPLGPREFPARPSSATPTGGHAAAAPQYFSVSAAPGLQPAWGSGLGGSSSMSLDAWGSLAVSTEHAPMAATAALAAAPAAPASAPAALGQHLWAGGMPQFEQARPFPCF